MFLFRSLQTAVAIRGSYSASEMKCLWNFQSCGNNLKSICHETIFIISSLLQRIYQKPDEHELHKPPH